MTGIATVFIVSRTFGCAAPSHSHTRLSSWEAIQVGVAVKEAASNGQECFEFFEARVSDSFLPSYVPDRP